MKKTKIQLTILCGMVALSLSACQSNTTGSGPITFSPHVMRGYEHYIARPDRSYFAVTEDGTGYGYSYCGSQNTNCIVRPLTALHGCFRNTKQKCKIFASKFGILWRHSSGRPITLNEVSSSPTPIYQPKDYSKQSDESICRMALDPIQVYWDRHTNLAGHVEEALKRKLTLQQCANLTGRVYSNSQISTSKTQKTIKGSRPISVTWEGYTELLKGTVVFKETAGEGDVRMLLPNGEGTCTGKYRFSDIKAAIATWAVACTNNLAASGSLKGLGRGKGFAGEGTDTKGKKVKFTLGPKLSG